MLIIAETLCKEGTDQNYMGALYFLLNFSVRPKLDVSPALFHSPVLSAIPVGASGVQGLHCTHREGAPAQFPKGQEGNCQDTVLLLSFLKKNTLQ